MYELMRDTKTLWDNNMSTHQRGWSDASSITAFDVRICEWFRKHLYQGSKPAGGVKEDAHIGWWARDKEVEDAFGFVITLDDPLHLGYGLDAESELGGVLGDLGLVDNYVIG
jgi:hypothetical protein